MVDSARLFSVIVPTLNRMGLLEQTLASIWAQTLAPAQVIVVDDGSSDGTLQYLDSIRDRITVVQSPQQGPGSARNAGARVATADYVVFLDSDDLWFPWTLEVLGEAIRIHDQPSYLCGSFRQFTDERELLNEVQVPLTSESFPHYLATWPRQLVIGAGMIAVRRETFLASGGFSSAPINLEDHDLSLKLGLAPGFVQIVRPATLAWRLHRGGVTRDLSKSEAGCATLMDTESAGGYPGGSRWAAVRRNIITTHTRPFSIECLAAGNLGMAWRIYLNTLAWHLRLGRLRYLALFPLMSLWSPLRARRAA